MLSGTKHFVNREYFTSSVKRLAGPMIDAISKLVHVLSGKFGKCPPSGEVVHNSVILVCLGSGSKESQSVVSFDPRTLQLKTKKKN